VLKPLPSSQIKGISSSAFKTEKENSKENPKSSITVIE